MDALFAALQKACKVKLFGVKFTITGAITLFVL